jgi:hypothetical protein
VAQLLAASQEGLSFMELVTAALKNKEDRAKKQRKQIFAHGRNTYAYFVYFGP